METAAATARLDQEHHDILPPGQAGDQRARVRRNSKERRHDAILFPARDMIRQDTDCMMLLQCAQEQAHAGHVRGSQNRSGVLSASPHKIVNEAVLQRAVHAVYGDVSGQVQAAELPTPEVRCDQNDALALSLRLLQQIKPRYPDRQGLDLAWR